MDKRQEPRIPVKDSVSLDGKGGELQGTLINLSVNGCAFRSDHAIDPDVPIQLELCIPTDKEPVKVSQARLAWKSGDMMGVQFLNMNETSMARLQRYIDHLPQDNPT